MAVYHEELELLHLMGASDTYISNQLQRYSFITCLQGAASGTAIGLICLLLISFILKQQDVALIPNLTISTGQIIILLALPLFIAVLGMLTAKSILYVCNVSEDDAQNGNEWSDKVAAMAAEKGASSVVICASIESEIAQLESVEERNEFLETIGLEEAGLDRIIKAGYKLLGLQNYFTAGPQEARAWTIKKDSKAPQAAGVIHGDFEKGFIKAEVIAFEDYVGNNGEQGAKDAGKMRQEGKEYIVADGDVILFRFNV